MIEEQSLALEPMLRKLRLWVALNADDEQALLDLPHTIVTVRKQQAIVTENDVVSHCWLMLTGYCVRYKIVGDGRRQIVSIHMHGDLVDLQNALLGVADHGIQMLTDGTMAKVPIDAIRQLSNTRPAIKARSGTTPSSTDRSIASGWPMSAGATRPRASPISCVSLR